VGRPRVGGWWWEAQQQRGWWWRCWRSGRGGGAVDAEYAWGRVHESVQVFGGEGATADGDGGGGYGYDYEYDYDYDYGYDAFCEWDAVE